MRKIELSWSEVEIAAGVGMRRQIESLRSALPDKHGYEGEGWNIHIEGAAGELVVAKALGRYWDGSVGTFKRGGDVGNIQVRTRSKITYDLIVRDDDKDDDWFVLVLGKIPTFYIAGYIQGVNAKNKDWLQTYGNRPPAYFVPQPVLIQL
jgi:hypothetical protein